MRNGRPLLHDVGQFMSPQVACMVCITPWLTCTKHDMRPNGERVGAHRLCRGSCLGVCMDADATELMTEARLHVGTDARVKRLAG